MSGAMLQDAGFDGCVIESRLRFVRPPALRDHIEARLNGACVLRIVLGWPAIHQAVQCLMDV